jgi:hypothetical protein
MTSGMYFTGVEKMALNTIKWTPASGSAMKCCLCDVQPTQADTIYTNISTDEIDSSSSYTQTGAAMTLVAAAYDTGYVKFDADDVTWALSSDAAQWAVVYLSTTGLWLWSFHDFGTLVTGGGGNYTVQWNAAGVSRIQITTAA